MKIGSVLQTVAFTMHARPVKFTRYCLTHWGRVMHICVNDLTIIGSDNGLSPGRRQAIIWTNAGILLIGALGTNFSEILIEIHAFSFKKIHLKMSSAKWRPFCLSLDVLKTGFPPEGCKGGANLRQPPLMAAAHGCTLPLWRMHCGFTAARLWRKNGILQT